MFRSLPFVLLVATACATAPTSHGTISDLSTAKSADYERCQHRVPAEVCTRCHPSLIPKFKAVNDWCPEHAVAESQCFECHPDLNFDPLPALPQGADVREISKAGEDVPSLEAQAVPGKITVFDFYAVWCAPCREVDRHLYGLMGKRSDLAIRKINVVSWETPVARRWMADAPTLPFVIVHDRQGKRVRAISGLDAKALDAAIAEAAAR